MKFGARKRSYKKSFSARTTGKAKRAIKKSVIPSYGKKTWAGLTIQRKQHITRFITRQVLD